MFDTQYIMTYSAEYTRYVMWQ